MYSYDTIHDKAFSLLELMVTIAIVSTLAYLSVGAYRDYTIRSYIAALIPLTSKVKVDVEDAHNQGTIFGASGTQIYVASGDADKPVGLDFVRRVSYGCVEIGIDLADLNLLNTNSLTLTLCPETVGDSIEWNCGYDPTSTSAYLKYLPSNCQTDISTLVDTSF